MGEKGAKGEKWTRNPKVLSRINVFSDYLLRKRKNLYLFFKVTREFRNE